MIDDKILENINCNYKLGKFYKNLEFKKIQILR